MSQIVQRSEGRISVSPGKQYTVHDLEGLDEKELVCNECTSHAEWFIESLVDNNDAPGLKCSHHRDNFLLTYIENDITHTSPYHLIRLPNR